MNLYKKNEYYEIELGYSLSNLLYKILYLSDGTIVN